MKLIKMKTLPALVSIVAFVPAFAVSAGDFTWTGGGAAGDWTDPANWGVESGYPQVGDSATFKDSATITSDFDMGGTEGTADVLTVTIADGTTLTIDASISGEGGFTREGSGALVLKKANPFKGKFQANGWTAKDKTKANILTTIYDSGALGTQAASFDNGKNWSFASLVLDASAVPDGTMTISIPLTLCRLVSETGRPNLQLKNGSFVFKGEINAPYRLVFGGSEIGDAWFGRVSGTGYFQPAAAFQKTSHLYFTDQVSLGAFYAYNNKSTWVLRCPNGVTGDVTLYASPFVCETNDVFAAMSNKGFPWASHNSTDGGRIDLNGFDQNFPNEQNGCFVCRNTAPVGQPITNYGFTSPADRPANVILSGAGVVNAAKSQRYNGHFYGAAGLVWDPSDAEAEFVFSNVVHDTTGELVVSNGIVRLFDGASFTALSKLTVASGATLKADDSYDATSGHATGADFFAQEIKVAADAKLDLPRDVTLVTKKFAVGDEVVTAVGKYTRADYPDLFTGDGTVEIKGVPCSFTGPSGGLWSDPDNWEGGALPDEQSAVIIPAGKSVVIDETNAEVYSVAIGGGNSAATLTMTNWNTCLQAKYINVLNKGVITTTDAFTNETQKCRVWIKCIDFNLASGASIAMDGKGWMGGHYNLTNPDDSNPSGAWYNDDGVNHG